MLDANKRNWLVREILNNTKRVLKRIDVTSRSLVTLIEPGSCFAGTLAEIIFACDRAYMFDGQMKGDNRPAAAVTLSALNFGQYPDVERHHAARDALPRRARERRQGQGADRQAARRHRCRPRSASSPRASTRSTGRTRCASSSRSARAFSADGLTGLEANLRFAGPETMETKIFGRLTAWQNWIFQRPNAVGGDGALRRYGTGVKADFNKERV